MSKLDDSTHSSTIDPAYDFARDSQANLSINLPNTLTQTNKIEQNFKPSTNLKSKRRVITVILVLIVILVALPFLFVGGVFAYCGIKDVRMNRLASDISKKAKNSGLNVSIFRSAKNGDCLTGNGADFIIDINEKYTSPIAARDDIFAKFSAAGIAMPSVASQEGRASAKSLSGASGGNTPIEVIQMYFTHDGNSLTFDSKLEERLFDFRF